MNFLKDTKTNWKYVIAVLLVATLSGGIIYKAWSYYQEEIDFLNQATEAQRTGHM